MCLDTLKDVFRYYMFCYLKVEEKIFIFGGFYEGALSSCEMFNLSDPGHKSHFLTPMSEAKHRLEAVVYDKTNVVVLGGIDGDSRVLSTACILDTINDTWIELPPMPTPRSNFALGVAGS